MAHILHYLSFILLFLQLTQEFDFQQIQVSPTSTIVGIQTLYNFKYYRGTDNNDGSTNFDTQPVSQNSPITITFPSNYPEENIANAQLTLLEVDFVQISVLPEDVVILGNTITINGAFQGFQDFQLQVQYIIIEIDDITNPIPAVRTSPFTGTIGNDNAIPSGFSDSLAIVTLTPSTSDACSIVFSPNTVNLKNTSMQIEIDPNNPIDSTASILLKFPNKSWSNRIIGNQDQIPIIDGTMKCSAISGDITQQSCTGDYSQSSIEIFLDTIDSTYLGNFTLQIDQLSSPPTVQQTDYISITIKLDGSQLETCSASPSNLQPGSLLNLAITPIQDMVVNTQVGVQITFKPNDDMDVYDVIQITFPAEITPIFNTVNGTLALNSTSYITDQTLYINLNTSRNRNISADFRLTYDFYKIRGPPSVKITDDIIVTVTRNENAKITGSTSIQAIAQSINCQITFINQDVGAQTSYTFQMILTSGLSSNGYIQIIFPSQVSANLLSTCSAIGNGTGINVSPNCQYQQNSKTMSVKSLSSGSLISAQQLKITVTKITNPPSIKPTSNFGVITYYEDQFSKVAQNYLIQGVTAEVSTISIAQISSENEVVYQKGVTYYFNFTINKQIPEEGKIQILIPNQIFLMDDVDGQCRISTDDSLWEIINCSNQTSADYQPITLSQISQKLPDSQISIKIIQRFRNPADTGSVTGFHIKTYHSDGYQIEQLVTSISFRVNTPADFTNIDISSSSTLNSDPATTYTFTLNQVPPLPSSSKVQVTFPKSLKLTSGSTSTCQDLSGTPLTCTYSTISGFQTLEVQLTSDSFAEEQTFGFSVGSLRNMPSFAPFVDEFEFKTVNSAETIEYASGSYLPSIQNTQASQFTDISGTFSKQIFGESTILQVTLTPSGFITPSTVRVNLATSFSIPSSLSCPIETCSYDSASSHSIIVTGINSNAQLSFSVQGIQAPTEDPTDYTSVTSYDSNGYKIDEYLLILWQVKCTLPCRTCTTDLTECLSCYTEQNITIFSYFYPSNNSCQIFCPQTTYEDNDNYLCSPCDNDCYDCSIIPTNCTQCDSSSTLSILNMTGYDGQCVAGCGIYHYPDEDQIPVICTLCSNIHSHCLKCDDEGICIECTTINGIVGYLYNGTCSIDPDDCPPKISIPNQLTNQCEQCDSSCAQCSISIQNCTACQFPFGLKNITDPWSCDICDPLFYDNGYCTACIQQCGTCSLTYDNCSSCDTTSNLPYLFQFSCYASCPFNTHYEDLNLGQCRSCSDLNINCDYCIDDSTCEYGGCKVGFVYLDITKRCYNPVPSGYFDNSGIAEACDSGSDCATCIDQATKCTSCLTKNLQGNDCFDQCDAGYVSVNRICELCSTQCQTCSNLQSNCTSCNGVNGTQLYLSNYRCQEQCPTYTYPNTDDNICQNCVSPCETCVSATLCQSCVVNYYLQDSTDCVQTCRDGYIGISRVCTRCTSPCDFCSGALDHCTKCIDNYYLITALNDCVSDCSTVSLYNSISTGECTGCTAPCQTCQTEAENCLSCESGFNLLGNDCVTDCGDGYYALNQECLTCQTGCETCTSASVCQTCDSQYYLYNSKCLSECPDSHPVITNQGNTDICTECTDSNCLVCDSLDQCSSCQYPYLVYAGACLSDCPTNFTSNSTNCLYDPQQNSEANETLNETLSSQNIFPVPFTIGGTFIGIACLMSKFQHSATFIVGALYSLIALLEWGAIGVAFYLYYLRVASTFAISSEYLEALIYLASVAFFYLLNILALIVQNCFLRSDGVFRKWQNRQSSNFCWYCASSVIGVVMTHKFKNILFSKLFGFQVFKARLEDVQNFRVFNVFSFLSFVSSGGILFATCLMIVDHHEIDQQLMAYIDVLVLTVICIILAILSSIKGFDFFQEKDDDGYILNKRITDSETLMNQAVVPTINQNQSQKGGNINRNIFDTQRKFRSILSETFTQQYQTPSIHVQDISIQAAPIVQDYSKIDFYDDRQLSSFSMVNKFQQPSIHSSPKIQKEDVSVQNQPHIFEDISIQNNPINQEKSIQQKISNADASLQNVPLQDDAGIQMSKEQAEHSIQAVANFGDASVQYSDKPYFQSISKNLMEEGQEQIQEQIPNTKNKQQINQAKQQPQNTIAHNHQRMNSQKTEKQIINMLSKPELEQDLSLNITQQNNEQNKQEQNPYFKYEEKSISVQSQEDNQMIQIREQKKYKPENQVIKQDEQMQQMPTGIQKSGLTNLFSDKNKKPTENQESYFVTSNEFNFSAVIDDDPIVNGPINAIQRKKSSYRIKSQEQNNDQTINVRNFLDQQNSRNSNARIPYGLRNLDKHQPVSNYRQIPLPEVKRLKSQQSFSSPQKSRIGRTNLLQGRRLQLNLEDTDSYMQSEQSLESQLPQVLKTNHKELKKSNSKSKLSQKTIHRQILGGTRYEKYYEKQRKKNQNTRKRIQQLEAKQQRSSNYSQERGYMRDTYASSDKKRKSSLQKKDSLQKVHYHYPLEKKY